MSFERKLTYRGETLSVAEWSRKIGLKDKTIYMRLNAGWPVEKVLERPLQQQLLAIERRDPQAVHIVSKVCVKCNREFKYSIRGSRQGRILKVCSECAIWRKPGIVKSLIGPKKYISKFAWDEVNVVI